MMEDLNDFTALRNSRGYQKLQALWIKQGKDIMVSLNKAAKEKGKDDSLRWNAGALYGYDLAIAQLDRAIEDIQRNMGNSEETSNVDELLKRVEGRIQ